MKKIAMFMAAAAIAVSASAQKTAITSSKALDNTYVGIKAGATTAIINAAGSDYAFSAYDPSFGIRAGKNFTTVFGLALDANMYFNVHTKDCAAKVVNPANYTIGLSNGTFIKAFDVTLLGTANLSNAFAGYKGEPRDIEVIAVGGFGWQHGFGKSFGTFFGNTLVAKAGVDIAYNFGSDKQWQAYIEPSINYGLETFGYYSSKKVGMDNVDLGGMKFNAAKANVSLMAGINYKFPCSNGKHNFAIEQLRDQAEIDGLNAKINQLRSDVDAANAATAAANAKAADLQKQLTACLNKPVPVVEKKAANLQPSVVFAQGKSVVEKSQMANVQMIANYMKQNPNAKVKISGYASPEGSKELNQKLSEARAAAVKDVLVKKYKVSADRLTTEGLGATDKLFDEVEFNRVALFNDTTK